MWTTKNELEFLNGIGRNKWPNNELFLDRTKRSDIIIGYIAASHNRDDWGEIDKEFVVNYARSMLGVALMEEAL